MNNWIWGGAWLTFITACASWLISRLAKNPETALDWKIESMLWFLVAIFLAVVSSGTR
jgi:hypothetical protein